MDLQFTVDRGRQATLLQMARIAAQAHGASLGGDPYLVGHQSDNGVGGGRGQLTGVGVRQAAHMTGKFHHGHLHPQADAQEGHAILPGVPDSGDHPLHAPVAEAAGH